MYAGTGEENQNEPTLHFGLDHQSGPVHLEITWPNAFRQVVEPVEIDKQTSIRFGEVRSRWPGFTACRAEHRLALGACLHPAHPLRFGFGTAP